MKYVLFMFFLLGLSLFSLAAATSGSSILANVNGEAVTLGAVLSESAASERLARAYADNDFSEEILSLRQAAVDRIIDRKLMIAEFKRLNLVLPLNYVESLMDDLAENMAVFQRCAGVDDVFAVPEAVSAQDVGDIAAREVDPVHLCVVRPVIIIALLLPGPVEDHVAGRDDVLLSVEIKVALAGGDIEQLKVHPAAGAVGRQLGRRHQPVGAAAPHKQRVFPVLEINSGIVPVGAVYKHLFSLFSLFFSCYFSCSFPLISCSFPCSLPYSFAFSFSIPGMPETRSALLL
jgi:hypothetical protein